MYALILVRYRRPLAEVGSVTEAHRPYLGTLKAQGTLLSSEPLDPRFRGVWLVRVQDENPVADQDTLRDGDPLHKAGLANWGLLVWRCWWARMGWVGCDPGQGRSSASFTWSSFKLKGFLRLCTRGRPSTWGAMRSLL